MTNRGAPTDGGGGGGYHTVQAERDLESNWEVDLANKLEAYLLKICSGEILDESEGHIPVNFAEAALLLQGSVQVYSRKVEYLYSLVLRSLEFLSQKRQEEQLEGTSDQPRDSAGSKDKAREDNDIFWDLDDIPVEAKNCLDTQTNEDTNLNNFVKPPANLVVLEGDCLDTSGDAGELESYLLATSDLYRGFILLDPCDAVAVQDYLDVDSKIGKGLNSTFKGSTARRSFQSPIGRSGGASHKSSIRKGQDHENFTRSPPLIDPIISHDDDPPHPTTISDGGYDHSDDEDEDDDPWKPLNPHEPGDLKVKPFRKVKASKRNWVNFGKQVSIASLFPLARFHGPISSELRTIWEMRNRAPVKRKRPRESESLPLYEKLRQQLVNDESQAFDAFHNPKDVNEEDETHNNAPDFDLHDDDIPEFMDEEIPLRNDEHNDGYNAQFCFDDPFGNEDANSQANLEDLCRSHLDALLASIAETEKQSDLAARVTKWKQNIEKNLDDQDSHPEFDIHLYGERILDKLSLDEDDGNVLSFSDVVKGDVKYDVARTFSALLQLVNNGDVELDRNGAGGSVCFTAENPFRVRLIRNNDKKKESQFRLSRKRVKSPVRKSFRNIENEEIDSSKFGKSTPQLNGKFSVKVGKLGVIRHTPDGKKRRKSRLVVDSG